jgi:hypothetical protein
MLGSYHLTLSSVTLLPRVCLRSLEISTRKNNKRSIETIEWLKICNRRKAKEYKYNYLEHFLRMLNKGIRRKLFDCHLKGRTKREREREGGGVGQQRDGRIGSSDL